jgi:outer membrane usher protein FimD/PapC
MLHFSPAIPFALRIGAKPPAHLSLLAACMLCSAPVPLQASSTSFQASELNAHIHPAYFHSAYFGSDISEIASTDTQAFTPLHYQRYDFEHRQEAVSTEYSVFDTALDQSHGQLSSTFAASTDTRLQSLTRLETTWSGTLPFVPIDVRLGDAVSHPGTWSNAMRFGGIKLGSMQDLPGDLVTAPELSAGTAALPSAADLISRNIHTVSHIHAPGEVTFAVNDVLGRMREVTKPLHTDIVVAPKGKADYSLAAGRLREEFAFTDGRYGPRFTSATVRYGLRKSLTFDAHASQVDGVVSVMGAGLAKNAGARGKLSATMATSRTPRTHTSLPTSSMSATSTETEGWLARLSYQYENDYLVLALRSRVQSATYRDLNSHEENCAALRQRTMASITLRLGVLGDVLVAGAAQTFDDASHADFVSVRHSLPLGPAGHLSASFAYNTGNADPSSIYIAFTHPVGIR